MLTERERAPLRLSATPPSARSRAAAHRVAVIGGGITGLTVAWELMRRGIDVVVFEAADRPGGVIGTDRLGAWTAERGPNSLAATDDVCDLIEHLGIEAQVVTPARVARRRYVARGDTLLPVPSSPLELARTPLLSTRAKWRLLREPFVGRRADDAAGDESLGAFVRRRLGSEVLDGLVAPFVRGVYAGNADALSARHAMPRLVDLERRHGSVLIGAVRAARARRRMRQAGRMALGTSLSFRAGMGTLPDALASALGDRMTCGATVRRLARTATGSWRIDVERAGRSQSVTVAHAVIAVPAHRLRDLQLPASCRESISVISAVDHAPIATVSIGVRRDGIAHPLDGFGFLVADHSRRTLLGGLFTSSMFAGRCPDGMALLTCFVGGTQARWRSALPLDALMPPLLSDLRALLGATAAPSFVTLTAWPRAIPQYDAGHEAVVCAARAMETNDVGLTLAGGWRTGVSVGDCITGARMAAQRVIAHVGHV